MAQSARLLHITQVNQIKQQSNVIDLYDTKVATDIYTALAYLGKASQRTHEEYTRDARIFFRAVKGKEIEQLVKEDLPTSYSEVQAYQQSLIASEKYKKSTVNRMMASIRSLYVELEKNEYPVKSINFKVKNEKASDKQKHPSITWEEAEKCIEFVTPTRKGMTKALLIELACKSAFRKDALLSLKWSDFVKKGKVWVVEVLEKGQKVNKCSIYDEFMQRLLELKKYNKGTEKIFEISATSVDEMMVWLSQKMGKHVVFHSFKKCAINEVGHQTGGDAKMMQEIAHHESFTTTMDSYVEFHDDPELHPSLLIGETPDLSPIDNMSHEELLAFIKSQDRETQIKLARNARTHQ